MKIFVSCLGTHERVISVRGILIINQKMTHSMNSSQLFHQQLPSLSNGLMSTVITVAEVEVRCRLTNMNFH